MTLELPTTLMDLSAMDNAMARMIMETINNMLIELYATMAQAEIVGFLFRDKNGMPEVVLHWEHRFKNAVNRYNSIFKVQMPKITPHICRHTYCSNQAKAGMNPKTLQYLMGHSDIGVTMNTYTHLGLDDAKNEMIRMEELEQARKEVDKAEGKKPMRQNMFKVV